MFCLRKWTEYQVLVLASSFLNTFHTQLS